MANNMPFDINRREHPRVRTLLGGRVVFNDRCSVYDCVVRDLCEGGARIELGALMELPSVFELEVPKKNLRVWARRAWSHGTQHGLAFFEPKENAQPGALRPDQAAKLQKILQEARREIAQTIGVPVERVNLSLKVPENVA